jgi:hypothetical protein
VDLYSGIHWHFDLLDKTAQGAGDGCRGFDVCFHRYYLLTRENPGLFSQKSDWQSAYARLRQPRNARITQAAEKSEIGVRCGKNILRIANLDHSIHN